MQSAKKTKILSALSMAAAAAIAAEKAHGASLTMYYGQETNWANSSNGTVITNTYSPTGFVSITPTSGGTSTQTNSHGQVQYFGKTGSTITPVLLGNGAPNTITLPVGDYLSFAIDAVLTGNLNPQAGKKSTNDVAKQASYLGLSNLGMVVSSSDAVGADLVPLSNLPAGSPPSTTLNGIPSYTSTATINQKFGPNDTSGNAFNSPVNWTGVASGGDVQPNLTGYNTAPNSNGGIGTAGNSPGAFPGAGSTGGVAGKSSGATNPSSLTNFASSTNTASYAQASDFVDQLGFYGKSVGTVTLTPTVLAGATKYWTFSSVASSAHQYQATSFGSTDVISQLPVLVINITGVTPPSSTHPLLSFTATGPAANYGVQITNGTGLDQGTFNPNSPTPNALNLKATNAHNSYLPATLTSIDGTLGAVTDSVETTGVVSGDEVKYALDVLVNGTQATSGQISTLVTEIAANAGSGGIVASATLPAGAVFPAGNWNLYIDPLDIGGGTDWLGFDLSTANDSNLTGYSVGAVAAVPEPMTLGLLAVGGVGLMARRHRRKA